MSLDFPLVDSVWRNNKTGNLYKVLYKGTHTETVEELVVYQRCEGVVCKSNEVFCRPLSTWYEKFTKVVG